MRILVVYAHPRTDSFNAVLLRAFVAGLCEAGHEPDVGDLYAEGFDPRLGADELEHLGTGRRGADVRAWQERLLAADGLAFIFPIWWFGPPAILKGFVDRIFEENVAFRFRATGLVEGLLPQKRALVLTTTGSSALLYRTLGFEKPLQKTLCDWTLKVCGIKTVEHVLLYDVVKADDAVRRRYTEEARRLGREFFG